MTEFSSVNGWVDGKIIQPHRGNGSVRGQWMAVC